MAIVNITFDSVTKECKVAIDGSELSDVRSVSIYKGEEEGERKPEIHIGIEREDVDGFEIYTSLHADNKSATDYASADKTLVESKSYVPNGVQEGLSQLFK